MVTKEIESILDRVEGAWLERLWLYCKEQFSSVSMPSHDQIHHLRVWQRAKELVTELTLDGKVFTRQEITNLIIAIFFHDVGLTKTYAKQHGVVSRKMCVDYFQESHEIEGDDFAIILDAVEHHDDKEYKNMVYSSTSQKAIASILCTCDDLDAFGAIGVFRYIEIYLLRGIGVEDLASMVLKNLDTRFENFKKLYKHISRFFDEELSRFNYTVHWFRQLEKELKEGYSKSIEGGAIGVLNVLMSQVIEGDQTTGTICAHVNSTCKDPFVHSFFAHFNIEMKKAAHRDSLYRD
ncbi:MAG: HD domain-containing protein [Fibrobacterales bacterium]